MITSNSNGLLISVNGKLHPVTHIFFCDEIEPDFQFVIEGSAVTEILKRSIQFSNKSNGGVDYVYNGKESIIIDTYTPPQPSEYLIDWGDGTTTQVTPSTTPDEVVHTYGENYKDEYTITIKNYVSGYFQFGWYDPLLKVQTPLPKQVGRKYFESFFDGCQKLSYICDYFFKNCIDAVDMNYALSYSGIEEIPATLFYGCENVELMRMCFSYSKLKRLPYGLFNKLSKLKTLNYTCGYCQELEEIPDDLCKGLRELLDVAQMFQYCIKLKSTGNNTFEDCTNLRNAGAVFFCCDELEIIGDNICKNCISLYTVSSIFDNNGKSKVKEVGDSTFEGCSGGEFTNANSVFQNMKQLKKVGKNTFKGCKNIIAAISTFYGCESLESIDSGTFDDCSYLGIYNNCYYNCRSLTGEAEAYWLRMYIEKWNQQTYQVSAGDKCFYNCTKLSNYDAIPAAWK